jgi:probable phosphoglycerate mutase
MSPSSPSSTSSHATPEPKRGTLPHAGLQTLADLAGARALAPECDHFYFLRHGQTECNARRIFQGASEPLSALGSSQAVRAADRLADEPIRSIVSSSMLRALTTARTVSARHGLDPLVHDDLRERHFGDLIGTSSAELDWDCAPAHGETLSQFVERKRAGLAFALAQPGPVLVVAHGGSLLVLCAALGVPFDLALHANAHPLRFDRTGDGWRATALQQQQPADEGGSAPA